MKRLVVTTGGTGGHIFPAIAVAKAAMAQDADCRVLFMGGSGPEGRWAREAGLDFVELPAAGVLGKGFKALGTVVWMSRAIVRAMSVLKDFQPQAVCGFGGYAGFCPVLAARLRGIPCAVHEQNSVPGVTNRILGKVVNRVFASFPDDRGSFPAAKVLVTGNPVRQDIAALAENRPQPGHTGPSTRRILVLGGSQGAKAINDAVIDALPQLKELGVEMLHQAGKADEERVREAYAAAGADPAQVKGFMDDMAGAYAWADLIVCRAGASTVFEAACAGKPAIFVPFPFATHNHQRVNAEHLARAGAALVVNQKELTGATLSRLIEELFADGSAMADMARAAHDFARPDAAARVARELEQLAA